MKINKHELKGLMLEALDALNERTEDKGKEEIVTEIVNHFAAEKENTNNERKPKQDGQLPNEDEAIQLLHELNEKMKDYPDTEKEVTSILRQLDKKQIKREVKQISKKDKEELLELSKAADNNLIVHQRFKNKMKKLGLG